MSPRQAAKPSITLENIAVVRGNRLVLDRLSLAAQPGDIVWIRGANGCGKSTLLRLVAGLLPKVSGQLMVEGKIALADENLALDPNLPLETALLFWARLDGAASDAREMALVAMDLVALADVPVRYLSTGQRKRATLSRLLASQAPVWLLDEPYNGLDSDNAARLDSALLKHSGNGGIALVAAHQAPSINVAQSISLNRRRAVS
jgi:heme exporter protein A